MKLVLFGDSLFARMSKHLVEMLEAKVPGSDVYNCATGGWNSNDCLKKAPYIAQLKPDVIAISLGTNDAAPYKQVKLEIFEDNVTKILNVFSGSKIIYFLPPPVDESKREGEKQIPNSELKKYYDAAESICKEKGALTINSWDMFKPMLDKNEIYHVEDGVHLQDNAYEQITDKIAEILN